ncbi:MAG: amino acid adenylation domain-containing protein [Bacteroidia bacterium]|nr:amino acid adenylation domain-containing protein [Bacteroidia bacterium]
MNKISPSDSVGDKRALLARLIQEQKEKEGNFLPIGSFSATLARNARAFSNEVALTDGELSYSFGQADQISWQIACFLGQNPGAIIFMAEPGPDWALAVLGALKAGATLVFLSENDPQEYHKSLLREEKVSLCIRASGTSEARFWGEFEHISLAELLREASHESDQPVQVEGSSQQKLVKTAVGGSLIGYSRVEMATRIQWLLSQFKIEPGEAWGYADSPVSERVLVNLLWPLLAGCKVVFSPNGLNSDTLKTWVTEKVCMGAFSIEQLNFLAKADHQVAFRKIFWEGNALSDEIREKLPEIWETRMIRLVSHPLAGGEIGWSRHSNAFANPEEIEIQPAARTLLILDQAGNRKPSGMKGRFAVADLPENQRTGRTLEDDSLVRETLGGKWVSDLGGLARSKVNGTFDLIEYYRRRALIQSRFVPFGWIEAAILQVDFIGECCLAAYLDANGAPMLEAFVTSLVNFDQDQLRARLARLLPANLIPRITRVPNLPLDAQGNPDLKFLREKSLRPDEIALQAKEIISQLAEVEEAAILARELPPKPDFSHLSELLGDKIFPQFLPPQDNSGEEELRNFPPDGQTFRPSVSHGPPLKLDPRAPRTLQEALRFTAEKFPLKGIHILDKDRTKVHLSYAQLLSSAQSILHGLRKAGLQAGDIILLQLEYNREVIPAYWACILGGFVCLPIAVPMNWSPDQATVLLIRNAWELCEKPLILTSQRLSAQVKELETQAGMSGIRTLELENLLTEPQDENWHPAQQDDAFLLLLTSGSTGVPKAVMQHHAMVLSRFAASAQVNHVSHHDVSLNWFPLDHVGGLIMFHTMDLWAGCEQIQVDKELILEKPLLWLDLLEKYRVTLSWAPNFAFGLINSFAPEIASRKWDLSSVRTITNAAEPIVRKTALKFLEILAPHGLKKSAMVPAWGMSETSSAVTYAPDFVQPSHLDPRGVGVGFPVPGLSLRIVNQNQEVVHEGVTGNLQVKGPSVTRGYYRNPEKNQEVFTADGWFDTGDFAFLQDGNLTITGRARSIIINGINFQNSEIESVAESVEGVRVSFAAALPVRELGSETDQAALFFVPEDDQKANLGPLLRKIRLQVTQSAGINPAYLIPVSEEDIPKTAVGKIQRGKLSKRLCEGDFKAKLKIADLALENSRTLPNWFFKKVWTRENPRLHRPLKDWSSLLIFMDEEGLGEAICKQIPDWVKVVKVVAGEEFKQLSPLDFRVNLSLETHFKRLVSEFRNLDFLPEGVIHLWSYPELSTESDLKARFDLAQENGIFSLQKVVRMLEKLNSGQQEIHLQVVSRGVWEFEESRSEPEKATLPGLLNSLALESNWLKCRHIDLGQSRVEVQAGWVIQEMQFLSRQVEVLWRNGKRRTWRLEKVIPSRLSTGPSPLQKGGLYLVTGALGGIGFEVAKWLLAAWQARLILIGRTSPADLQSDATKWRQLRELQALGPEVEYFSANVADLKALAEIISCQEQKHGQTLTGIFHLAVSDHTTRYWDELDQHQVPREERQEFEALFEARVYGTQNLFQLLENRSPTFFFTPSSTNGLFGGAGFGAYGATQSFVAEYCRVRSKEFPGRVWCPSFSTWEGIGLAQNDPEFTAELFQQKGFSRISIPRGIQSIEGLFHFRDRDLLTGLDDSSPNISRYRVDGKATKYEMQVFAIPGAEKLSPDLLAGLGLDHPLRIFEVEEFPRKTDGEIDFERLKNLSQHETGALSAQLPVTETQKKLLTIWREVLGSSSPGIHDNFFASGGHSLLAIRINARIREIFALDLPLNFLFQSPTVAKLSLEIDRKLQSGLTQTQEISNQIEGDVIVNEFPLTELQEAYWVGRNRALGLGNAGCQNYQEFRGKNLDLQRFNAAFNKLIARHEILRSVVQPSGNWKLLNEFPAYQVEISELKGTVEANEKALQATRERMSGRIFETDQWPLFEIMASRLPNGVIHLHMSFDLIILDNWSLGLLSRDLTRLYENPGLKLPSMTLSTGEFLRTMFAARQSENYHKDLKYWQDRLPGLPPAPVLPLARAQESLENPRFARIQRQFSATDWTRLKEMAVSHGVTPSVLLCTAYAEVLRQWSESPKFCLNVLYFSRPPIHPEVNELVGNLSSTILLEVDFSAGGDFVGKAKRLQTQLWQDMEHARVSGVTVIREYNRVHGQAGAAAMPVTFSSILRDPGEAQYPDAVEALGLESMGGSLHTPQVILDQKVAELPDGTLILNWDFVAEVFPEGVSEAMLEAFCELLERLLESHAWQVSHLSLVPALQMELFATVNQTQKDFPSGLIYSPFLERVRENPDRPALICGTERFTYQEVFERALALAEELKSRGAGPGRRVALVMKKGWEEVVGALGVMFSGAAYVPVDAAFPPERIRQLLGQSGAEIVLTQSRLESVFSFISPEKRISTDLIQPKSGPHQEIAQPGDLAYLIFTSGSSGTPKAVMISHEAALNTLQDIQSRYEVGPGDRVLALSSFGFDLSVFDVFGLLNAGGTVVIPHAEGTRDPGHWRELLFKEQITIWNSVPALLQILTDVYGHEGHCLPPSLRLVMLSGDWIPLNLARKLPKLAPRARIYSLGGATEASIWSIHYPIQEIDPRWTSIPYGKALSNQEMWVLDDQLQVRPAWATGDIYIGGKGLALGYLNDAEKTNLAFVEHPVTGQRLYRTGDLGRWLPDGNIEFLGRKDNQVKVQGYRIECGEIEAALEKFPGIRTAVVMVKGERMGDKQLLAYCVASGDKIPEKDEIQAFLQGILPPYMVPSRFVFLESMPLSLNGKVDRGALLKSESSRIPVRLTKVSPRTLTEKRLALIWDEILGVSDPGIQENFFELGGNSLTAMRFVALVKKHTGSGIPLSVLFKTGTIEKLAAYLDQEQVGEKSNSLVPIQEKGGQTPLFFVHPSGGNVLCYVRLAQLLGPEQPFYGLASREGGLVPETVEEMAAAYLDEIRSVQKDGPYQLGGWSLGGLIAWEMARQLEQSGQEVGLLVMVDTFSPQSLKSYQSIDPHTRRRAERIADLAHFAADLAASTGKGAPFAQTELKEVESARQVEAGFQICRDKKVIPAEFSLQEFEKIFAIFQRNIRAGQSYLPGRVKGRKWMFLAGDSVSKWGEYLGWKEIVPEIEGEVIPGNHQSIMEGEGLARLAGQLKQKLQGAIPPNPAN